MILLVDADGLESGILEPFRSHLLFVSERKEQVHGVIKNDRGDGKVAPTGEWQLELEGEDADAGEKYRDRETD